MIGYKQPLFTAKVAIVKQDFDIVHETDYSTLAMQVKPSLDNYDTSDYDSEHSWLETTLSRWGDRRMSKASA